MHLRPSKKNRKISSSLRASSIHRQQFFFFLLCNYLGMGLQMRIAGQAALRLRLRTLQSTNSL